MRDLHEALRKAMREQGRITTQFTARWRADTMWQHKKKEPTNDR